MSEEKKKSRVIDQCVKLGGKIHGWSSVDGAQWAEDSISKITMRVELIGSCED